MRNRRRRQRRRGWGFLAVPVIALIALAVTGVIFWNHNESAVTVHLDTKELTVEYGSEFFPPAVSADFSGKYFYSQPTELQVTMESNVDTSVLGSYTVVCSAEYTTGWLFGSQTYSGREIITVQVVDTQAPVITLTQDPEGYTLPGRRYEEEGFLAVDDYDGDITHRVVRAMTETSVIYTVTDSSGNQARAERNIVYADPVAPQIQLLGAVDMSLVQGGSFTDPGWSASDNCDGDLTAAVQVSGTVDSSKPGNYTLHYSVSDASGNVTEAVRTVKVMERSWVHGLPMGDFGQPEQPEGKVIYLTFDDGPSQYTPELLKVLDKYNVKATFFVVNTRYVHYVADIAAAGHQIGMHSTSHNYDYIYGDEDAFYGDLWYIQQQIYKYTGRTPTIFRFPGGTSNTAGVNHKPGIVGRICYTMLSIGYRWFDWNVDSKDAVGASSSEEVFRNVINGIGDRDVAVVLQHDTTEYSVAAVERIILWALENGYRFEVLDTNSPACQHGTRD